MEEPRIDSPGIKIAMGGMEVSVYSMTGGYSLASGRRAKRAPHGSVRLEAHADTTPIRPAEQRYVQEHGSAAYAQLLASLFDEFFSDE